MFLLLNFSARCCTEICPSDSVLCSGAAPLAQGLIFGALAPAFLGGLLITYVVKHYSHTPEIHPNTAMSGVATEKQTQTLMGIFLTELCSKQQAIPKEALGQNKGFKEVSVLTGFCFMLGRGESEHVWTAKLRL